MPFRGKTTHVGIADLRPGIDILAKQVTLKQVQIAPVVTAGMRRIVPFAA
jgi:hypothetical protein